MLHTGMGQAVLGSWQQGGTVPKDGLGLPTTAKRSVRSCRERGRFFRGKQLDVGALPLPPSGRTGNGQSQKLLPPSQETVISPPTHCSQTTLSDDASRTTWLISLDYTTIRSTSQDPGLRFPLSSSADLKPTDGNSPQVGVQEERDTSAWGRRSSIVENQRR